MTSEEVQGVINILESEKKISEKENVIESGEYEFSSCGFDSN